jgi:hypothetical protein
MTYEEVTATGSRLRTTAGVPGPKIIDELEEEEHLKHTIAKTKEWRAEKARQEAEDAARRS